MKYQTDCSASLDCFATENCENDPEKYPQVNILKFLRKFYPSNICFFYCMSNVCQPFFQVLKRALLKPEKAFLISLQKLILFLRNTSFRNWVFHFMGSQMPSRNKKYILRNNFRGKHSLIMKFGEAM